MDAVPDSEDLSSICVVVVWVPWQWEALVTQKEGPKLPGWGDRSMRPGLTYGVSTPFSCINWSKGWMIWKVPQNAGVCVLNQALVAKRWLCRAQGASVPSYPVSQVLCSWEGEAELEQWVWAVVSRPNQARKSFGAYGPQCVVQVQQLGECPAGRLLLALQQ